MVTLCLLVCVCVYWIHYETDGYNFTCDVYFYLSSYVVCSIDVHDHSYLINARYQHGFLLPCPGWGALAIITIRIISIILFVLIEFDYLVLLSIDCCNIVWTLLNEVSFYVSSCPYSL